MSRKWIVPLATVAAAGGVAAGATAVLGESSELDNHGAAKLEVSVDRSAGASAAGAAARTAGKTKFTYPSTGTQTVEAAPIVEVDISSCPRKSKVVNGFFETGNFQTDDDTSVLETSHPLGKRSWRVRLINFGGSDLESYEGNFGLVCAQSKKKK
jgi:hypothetical protein